MTQSTLTTTRHVAYDDLRTCVGERFGPTTWTLISQPQVDAFAAVTYDDQWIHVDPERAKAGPFGTTIAHGYLTLSLVPLFLGELLEVEGISMAVNYGLEKVRFPAPVPVGSQVRCTADLVSAAVGPKSTKVTMTLSVECDASERPACVADVVILFFG